MFAEDVIKEILDNNPKIKLLNFFNYMPQKNISELSEKITISRLLYHNSLEKNKTLTTRCKVLYRDYIKIHSEDLTDQEALALGSKVKISHYGAPHHIPMMDFIENDVLNGEVLAI